MEGRNPPNRDLHSRDQRWPYVDSSRLVCANSGHSRRSANGTNRRKAVMQIVVCISQLENSCRRAEGKQRWLDCFRDGRVARLGRLFVDRYTARNQRVTGNHFGTESFVPARWAGPFYDAAVSTTALDVRIDFRFAIWPSPLFFASADRVAAYSGATIG